MNESCDLKLTLGEALPDVGPSLGCGLCLSVFGVLFFTLLFFGLQDILFKTRVGIKIQKTFRLSVGESLDICNKLVSAVQAILACCAGYLIVSSCKSDFMRDQHYMVKSYAWFCVMYFCYDTWSMYYSYCYMYHNTAAFSKLRVSRFMRHSPMMIVHHLLFTVIGFPLIVWFRRGHGDCLIGFGYLMELSTPFVSLRAILSRLKMKTSWLYVVNGIVMIVTFFYCRIYAFPKMYYIYAMQIGQSMTQVVKSIPLHCNVGSILVILPQLYWFSLMIKGVWTYCTHTKKLGVNGLSKTKIGSGY